jgi:MFS family permease
MAGPATGTNPIRVIDDNPMSWRQWVVVWIMVFLNALDGFDVLSSAFAAPGITEEWGIPRSELGVMLSAELVGMGFGSVLLGGFADKAGRKLAMLVCLVIMAAGMYMAHDAQDLWSLTVWRFITGLGIGGMLAATNAMTAETSSKSGRGLAMALYVIGYPVGGVIGGFAAQTWLLVDYDWRAVFLFGAIVTAAMIPLVLFLVPETAAFYAARRPEGAVEKINRSLRSLRQPSIDSLPHIEPGAPKPKVTEILSNPRLRPVTLLLAFGYLFHTLTFYYVLKFAPTIVAGAGFTQAEAASSLTYANIGGALGGFLFGFLLRKWDIKGPTVVVAVLGSIAVAAFGIGSDTLWGWRIAAFLTMFFLNAAIVGYYAAFARGFPAFARATGTGFVLGVGRLGAAGSPIIAGFLFVALGNENLLAVSAIMAIGAVIGAGLIWLLPMRDPDYEASDMAPVPGTTEAPLKKAA